MKLILLAVLLWVPEVFAGNCTSTVRPNGNYAFGAVLPSAYLNADFNAVYGAVNDLDGGCVDDASLEPAALNSDFAALTRSLRGGCTVFWNGSNFEMAACNLSVNGNMVRKTTSTVFNFALNCTSCSSDVADTKYYIYAVSGSSGSTLNVKISNSAPITNDGYNASGDRVIAKFYRGTSAVDKLSVSQATAQGGYEYVPPADEGFQACSVGLYAPSWTTNVSSSSCSERRSRDGRYWEAILSVTLSGAPESETLDLCIGRDVGVWPAIGNYNSMGHCEMFDNSASVTFRGDITASASPKCLNIRANTVTGSKVTLATVTQAEPMTWAASDFARCFVRVPILGWEN